MTAWQFVAATWPWEPSVVLGCGALGIGYLAAVRWRLGGGAGCFLAGVVVLLLALDSPLDTLADTYLFSAHMAQHLLLLLVVPPLLLAGTPASLLEPAWQAARVRALARALGRPVVAWTLGVGTIWVWHIPALFNATLGSGGVHLIEHLSFLVTGVIFWWTILAPLREARLAPVPAMLYLLAAALASSVLGIVLTFARAGLYPAYLRPVDVLGIEPLIRAGWGLSPDTDQQIGGLLMWIPGGLVYLCAILGVLMCWYRWDEQDAAAGAAPAPDAPVAAAPALPAGELHAP
jgi:putative membrane protein